MSKEPTNENRDGFAAVVDRPASATAPARPVAADREEAHRAEQVAAEAEGRSLGSQPRGDRP